METNSKSVLNERDFLHEHIIKYRDETGGEPDGRTNKDLIVKAKLLEPASLDRAARLLYTYICMPAERPQSANRVIERRRTPDRTLLLHAPSSAYAKGERAEDQVLSILKRIRHASIAERVDSLRDKIDIMPHFFILHRDKRNPQHEASRASRIIGARSKFRMLQPVPELFFQQFDQILIIDDVSTTGHTLHALAQLFIKTYPMLADRVRTISIAH